MMSRSCTSEGSASEKYAKRIVPDGPPEKANDSDDYLDCFVFLTFFVIMLNYIINYAIIILNIF